MNVSLCDEPKQESVWYSIPVLIAKLGTDTLLALLARRPDCGAAAAVVDVVTRGEDSLLECGYALPSRSARNSSCIAAIRESFSS